MRGKGEVVKYRVKTSFFPISNNPAVVEFRSHIPLMPPYPSFEKTSFLV